MSEIDDIQTIYCTDCGRNYRIAWSADNDGVFVVCDCYEAEGVSEFIGRFLEEHSDDHLSADDARMFQ